MAKKIDLTKFKRPTQNYLKEKESSEVQSEVTSSKEIKKVVKTKKIGRPTVGEGPISKRFSLAFTEKEYSNLKGNAGKIPLASFIRDALKTAKVI
ncbi:MAG: hypothetical protein EBS06_08670 [Proteobacteria bacterium]|nr:hypothetical protein [Pseudomonadota bacterium]